MIQTYNLLTPIEKFGVFWLKRDDKFVLGNVNGGKVRQALYLIEKNLEYPDFYCGLGEVYLSLGMLEEGRDILQKALDKNPGYAQTHFLLAGLYEREGSSNNAITALQKCLDCSPSQKLYDRSQKALSRLKSGDG